MDLHNSIFTQGNIQSSDKKQKYVRMFLFLIFNAKIHYPENHEADYCDIANKEFSHNQQLESSIM